MRTETLKRNLQFVVDVAALCLAWYLSRLLQSDLLPAFGIVRWTQGFVHAPALGSVMAIWCLLALWGGTYRIRETSDRWGNFANSIHISIVFGCAIVIAGFFFTDSAGGHSRSVALFVTIVGFL